MSGGGEAAAASSYRLLDSGGGRKLEQAGPWLLDRQAPHAFWKPRLPAAAWQSAHGIHHRSEDGGGSWEWRRPVPEAWTIRFEGLSLEIRPTPFGHIGIFPEHSGLCDAFAGLVRQRIEEGRPAGFLNLFAYTGLATLRLASAGAACCHVDAAHGVVSWARRNAEASGLASRPVRWIVDDCRDFLVREAKRGRLYDGILLDPPTFGRGPKRQVWDIDRDLPGLLDACVRVLSGDALFLGLSSHTPGYTPLGLGHLLADALAGRSLSLHAGELSVPGEDGRPLPSGAVAWAERPRR